jgi:hypothetical protein
VGRARPLYQDIVSAVLGTRSRRQRTCCGARSLRVLLRQGAAGAVQAGFVLGRKGAFERTPALAVFPSWRRVGLGLLQSVFGGAQSRLKGLELLGLCRDGLLPGAGVSTSFGWV